MKRMTFDQQWEWAYAELRCALHNLDRFADWRDVMKLRAHNALIILLCLGPE